LFILQMFPTTVGNSWELEDFKADESADESKK
jgi:hypothetical protein